MFRSRFACNQHLTALLYCKASLPACNYVGSGFPTCLAILLGSYCNTYCTKFFIFECNIHNVAGYCESSACLRFYWAHVSTSLLRSFSFLSARLTAHFGYTSAMTTKTKYRYTNKSQSREKSRFESTYRVTVDNANSP